MRKPNSSGPYPEPDKSSFVPSLHCNATPSVTKILYVQIWDGSFDRATGYGLEDEVSMFSSRLEPEIPPEGPDRLRAAVVTEGGGFGGGGFNPPPEITKF
jgi:hypothetical protein